MSHTDRNEKRDPRERTFPYVPSGHQVLAVSIECALRSDDGFITAVKAVVIANRKPCEHPGVFATNHGE